MKLAASAPDLPGNRATRVGVAPALIVRVSPGHAERVQDAVAVEEPLQIRIHGEAWATTLRTPGSDSELVAGLLLAEGLIGSEKDVLGIAPCGRPGEEGYGNVVDVNLAPDASRKFDSDPNRRALFMNSACGVCGRAGIEDLLARLGVLESSASFDSTWLLGLVSALSAAQKNFAQTGGLHAAGIAVSGQQFRVVREDIGRHNAVDKAIGRLLLDDQLPASNSALVVSGRTGFEIVQKALVAGIPALISVSAPSSLAIRMAENAGLLLIGFAREHRFNIYAGGQRLEHLPTD